MTTPATESPRRTRNRGLALLAVAFLAGSLAGAVIDRIYVTRLFLRAVSTESAGPTREELQRRERSRLEREEGGIPYHVARLKLSDAQKAQVKAILARRRPLADSILASVLPRVRRLQVEMDAEMLCVLTKEQLDQWVHNQHEGKVAEELIQERLQLVTPTACASHSKEPG